MINDTPAIYREYESVSDVASSAACHWMTDCPSRRFILSDPEMKWLCVGAAQMSVSGADIWFWRFVADSCDFYNE